MVDQVEPQLSLNPTDDMYTYVEENLELDDSLRSSCIIHGFITFGPHEIKNMSAYPESQL